MARTPKKFFPWLSAAAAMALAALPAAGEQTRLAVRVLSEDAKFVGTSMGGAQVLIHDADTGELLAEGTTSGGTGDTRRIVLEPRRRGEPLSTPEAAGFYATLELERPRRVRITARGPLAQPQAIQEVSRTQWVFPGRHLDQGDAILLVLAGFVVDILEPPAHVRLGPPPQEVPLRINLTMM